MKFTINGALMLQAFYTLAELGAKPARLEELLSGDFVFHFAEFSLYKLGMRLMQEHFGTSSILAA